MGKSLGVIFCRICESQLRAMEIAPKEQSMERKKEFDLDQAQGLVVQGGNTGLELVGVAVEQP